MTVVVALLFGTSVAAALVDPAPDASPVPQRVRTIVLADREPAPTDEGHAGGEVALAVDDGTGAADPPSPNDAVETGAPPPAGDPDGDDPAAAIDVEAPDRPEGGSAVASTARDGRVALALEGWLAGQPDVGSVAVAVVAGGPGGYRWSGASTRPEAPTILDAGAVYPIMSVTKTFTEALVLREADKGTIDLDAPVPAIAGVADGPDGVAITPRMLLQHTSGLVNYMGADGYDPMSEMTPDLAVSLSLGTPLASEPGTVAAYANSNFHWLGLLLEHVTGRAFGDLVAEVAAEAELTSTALDPAARPGWVGFASGGMRSTLPDVARWGSLLFDPGAVLSPEWHEQHVAVGPLGVGLGVWPICPCSTDAAGSVEYTAVGQIVADGGLLWFPDGDVTVAVRMANVPGDVGTLTAAVAGVVRSALVDEEPDRVA